MSVDRRAFFKIAAAAGAAATVPKVASARTRPVVPKDAVGLLYDATKCIGCKACVVACKEANDLPADPTGRPGGLYDAPTDLSGSTKNLIRLAKKGNETSFMKSQCMHCVDPACVNACMMGSLAKREMGIVTWKPDKCIGCRYCAMACPFQVPKFEWSSRNPRVVKCELCAHRMAFGGPACAAVCPRKAVIFGKRDELLAEAKKRIQDNPQRYVPKVYGETDGGGTQCLYLSHIPFEDLGLPVLGEDGVPDLQQTIQHGLYKGFVAPAALYGILGFVVMRNRTKQKAEAGHGGEA
jgi:formate dehydrogenase beta subunit